MDEVLSWQHQFLKHFRGDRYLHIQCFHVEFYVNMKGTVTQPSHIFVCPHSSSWRYGFLRVCEGPGIWYSSPCTSSVSFLLLARCTLQDFSLPLGFDLWQWPGSLSSAVRSGASLVFRRCPPRSPSRAELSFKTYRLWMLERTVLGMTLLRSGRAHEDLRAL